MRLFLIFFLFITFLNTSVLIADDKADYNRYKQACDSGDALGCSELAGMYYTGKGVKQDYKMASRLLEQACDGGNAEGCAILGAMYYTGEDIKQDYIKARELFEKNCDGGDAIGCVMLGLMYELGHGVIISYDKALSLYKKTCEGENAVVEGCEQFNRLYKSSCVDGYQSFCLKYK